MATLIPVNEIASYEPFVAVDTAETPPNPPAGSYDLILRDANGNVLNTISFTPQVGEDDDESDPPAQNDFVVAVPIDPVSQPVPIREVQVSDGVSIIADIVGSTNFPSVSGVTVTATNGGSFTGSGIMKISWIGSDADPGAVLTYTVQYSSAGGTNWQTLASDLNATNYSLDSLYLAATTQGQVRVIASDGFDCSDPAYSAVFTVNAHAPTVNILAPMGSSSYYGDQDVSLMATADDPQDGSLTGASVVWTSSLNGSLGTGTSLSVEADTLTEGTHLITAMATDSLGLTNTASVTITVLRQSPPQLVIGVAGPQIQRELAVEPDQLRAGKHPQPRAIQLDHHHQRAGARRHHANRGPEPVHHEPVLPVANAAAN